jgi:HK97 family phage portal protein
MSLMSSVKSFFSTSNSIKAETRGPFTTLDILPALRSFGGEAVSGSIVTPHTARQIPTFSSAVNLIANDVSSLPLYLIQETENGPVHAVKHPLYKILRHRWNPEQSAREGLEYAVRQVVTTGNSFNFLELNPNNGRVQAIWPLFSRNILGRRENGFLIWDYNHPDTGQHFTFLDSQVLRFHSSPDQNFLGTSVLETGRDALGLSLDAQKASGKLSRRQTVSDGYFTIKENFEDLTDDEWDALADSWNNSSDKKPALPPGVEFHEFGAPNAQQTQFIERMKRQDLEICRLFNIPASILDANDKGDTFAASESQRRWYVNHTLRPWLSLIEEAVFNRCLRVSEQATYYAEFDTDVLTAADTQARYEANKIAIGGSSWETINEVRAAEGRAPVPGGDKLLVPANNMGTLQPDGSILPAGPPTPAPQPAPAPNPPAPAQASASILAIVRDDCDRIVRKEASTKKFDPKNVAKILKLSDSIAAQYCADRQSGVLGDDTAVDALMKLVQESHD